MENVRLRVGYYSYYSILHYVKTVYYYLAEPNEDVNTRNEDFLNTEDYLHYTAIS